MRYFYHARQLTTSLSESGGISYFHSTDHSLAVRDKCTTILFATNNQHTLLAAQCTTRKDELSYSAYGFTKSHYAKLIGFQGQQLHAQLGGYLLGNGYRAYSPTLLRFNSPDKLSPFLQGGVNAYAFVSADPINHVDPTGQARTRLFIGPGQRLAADAVLFRSKSKQGLKTLSLDAHSDGTNIYIGEKAYNPEQLVKHLKANKAEPRNFDRIDLYACHTADTLNGKTPYAQDLANLLQIPVTGHQGTLKTMVFQSPPSDLPTGLIRLEHRVFMEDPGITTRMAPSHFNYAPKIFQPMPIQADIRQVRTTR